jgi:hypothetical protein
MILLFQAKKKGFVRVLLLFTSVIFVCYKTILSVIYKFSVIFKCLYQAGVSVRIGSKRLPETNTLAYYKNSLITENSLLTLVAIATCGLDYITFILHHSKIEWLSL